MLNYGKPWPAILLVLVGGCSAHTPRFARYAPDWSDDRGVASTPAPAPVRQSIVSAPAPAPNPAPAPTRPLAATPGPAVTPPTETWVSLDRWCGLQGLPAPRRLGISPLASVALSSTNGVFVLSPGSLLARWDGVEVRLGYSPQSIKDQLYVHTVDLQKTIAPLIATSSAAAPGINRTIVIDPGHGGENPGTKSAVSLAYEKDLTLDWARRLQSLLTAKGWLVFLTRSNDTDLALSNRVAVADRHQAGLFLSLHFNSAGTNHAEFGLETYCLTPVGMPSTTTREFGDDLLSRYPNNAFDEQNLRLACQLHRALLRIGGAHDRGVRRARYLGVLRGQQRPAVLVEGGYLSSPHEARLIADAAYRQRLAVALATALEGNWDWPQRPTAQVPQPPSEQARDNPAVQPADPSRRAPANGLAPTNRVPDSRAPVSQGG